MNTIDFPGLFLKLSIDPVAFSFFGKDIYWYGILIATAIAVGAIYAGIQAKKQGLNPDIISDLILFGLPVAIICARLYYVLFSWEYYSKHLGEIIAVWQGGIAIYGAVIGAFLTAFLYCKVKKLSFLQIGDMVSPAFMIAQAIGRWGNFVNTEAYGRVTPLPWRMGLYEYGNYIEVHPTFLYESLWNVAGFALCLIMKSKKPFQGFLLLFYFFWYGLGRLWIEGLRTDSLMLGSVRISQVVAFVAVVASGILMYQFWPKQKQV